MNGKISVFVICVEAIICFLLYNLHDCTFKEKYTIVERVSFIAELFRVFDFCKSLGRLKKFVIPHHSKHYSSLAKSDYSSRITLHPTGKLSSLHKI